MLPPPDSLPLLATRLPLSPGGRIAVGVLLGPLMTWMYASMIWSAFQPRGHYDWGRYRPSRITRRVSPVAFWCITALYALFCVVGIGLFCGGLYNLFLWTVR